MKQCTVCSAQWPDDIGFCGNCGGALVSVDENAVYEDKTVAAYNEIPVPVQDKANDEVAGGNFGEQTVSAYANADVNEPTVASDAVSPENSYVPENSYIPQGFEPQQPKKKLFIKPLIIGGAALAVVIAVVITGFCTNWFGLGAPLNGLTKAFEKTVEAESLTFKATTKGASADEVIEGKMTIDRDEEDIKYIIEDESYKQCVVDGKMYHVSDGYAFESEFDNDAYKEYINDDGEIDWEKIVEDNDLEDYIDADEIEPFIEEFNENYLKDKEWLEEYLGFEKDGNDYIFEPELKKLFKEMKNICDDCDALTKEAKEEIKEVLDEAIEEIGKDDELTFTITVESGYIACIKIEGVLGGEKGSVEIELTDINDTEISDKEIDKIKGEAQDWIKEHTCDECDYTFYDGEAREYHGDCDDCGEHVDYLSEIDGYYYCDDCYDNNAEKCEMCGAYDDYLYRYAGLDMCWDCYYYYKY